MAFKPFVEALAQATSALNIAEGEVVDCALHGGTEAECIAAGKAYRTAKQNYDAKLAQFDVEVNNLP